MFTKTVEFAFLSCIHREKTSSIHRRAQTKDGDPSLELNKSSCLSYQCSTIPMTKVLPILMLLLCGETTDLPSRKRSVRLSVKAKKCAKPPISMNAPLGIPSWNSVAMTTRTARVVLYSTVRVYSTDLPSDNSRSDPFDWPLLSFPCRCSKISRKPHLRYRIWIGCLLEFASVSIPAARNVASSDLLIDWYLVLSLIHSVQLERYGMADRPTAATVVASTT
mmetsp:Transcript_40722/g.60358  ORF Transcript_40722/g.60358 Transcript_40722/m.60358 type:complete len:221 (+) Transcript_40722:342-1004(+)